MQKKEDNNNLIEKTVDVNRVCKVVKGGKRFGFAALVVVGDGKGKVGFASAKAREVPEAMKKATALATRRMVRIPLRDRRTIYHDVIGHFGSGYVKMRSAVPGTGIIAGGPARAVFEALGVADVVAKSVGSSNPHNMVKAVLNGLQNTHSPRSVAERRNKTVKDILGHRAEE